jgi:hypothetical protein
VAAADGKGGVRGTAGGTAVRVGGAGEPHGGTRARATLGAAARGPGSGAGEGGGGSRASATPERGGASCAPGSSDATSTRWGKRRR